jgi:hypothetical protein
MNDTKSFWATLPGILTGIAGILTAIGGLLVILYQIGVIGPDKTPDVRKPEIPKADKALKPETGTKPAPAPLKLEIRPAAVPHDLRPNTVYDISIMVVSEQGLPVENAVVEVRVGGGSFLDTGNLTTIGNTNAQGVFRTKWKSLDTIPAGYQFDVKVRKDGLSSRGELWIRWVGSK